ncbi:MAG: outer membrane protein assembly factor BamE [Gemmobacter sp.]|uniref:outer membrane protein assembly factor BamE n=1 Tax=Gemmobacter sp. TaxID=1898957 RepID=UPI00391BCEFD
MALFGLALVALGACTEIVRNHGYTPSEEDLATIAVGKDTRDTVAFKVGRPSAGGLMQDGGWYYVQSRWSHRGASAPKEVDRQVVAVSFDPRGRVSNIERFGLADGQVVALSRRVTDTNIKGIGLIRQLMGNLGRFNPGQFVRQGL